MTTVVTRQTASACRTAASCAGVPGRRRRPDREAEDGQFLEAPLPPSPRAAPPPGARRHRPGCSACRLTACQAMADWMPENGAGYDSSTRPGRQARRHRLIPARQDHRAHRERQAVAEDHPHRNEGDRREEQRTESAAPVGQQRVDVLEDEGQHDGRGQEADRHEALLDHVLEDGHVVEEPGRHPLAAPDAEREEPAHDEDEAEEPQAAVTPEGRRSAGEDGQEAPAEIGPRG